MNHLWFAIFDQDPEEFAVQLGRMSPQARERLIVLAAIALVVVAIVVWAAFFRKRPRLKRGHIKRDRHSVGKGVMEGLAELKRLFAMRERQRKRMYHRPRNPTLAETGGLPAPRNESDFPGDGDSDNARPNY